ncbi:hypothetical protein BDR26DRAFT_915937 [Obelidium mucronatum]|nr:hypothetical protein BDR26DRAFT_915937 [Obelidium mucronatum]
MIARTAAAVFLATLASAAEPTPNTPAACQTLAVAFQQTKDVFANECPIASAASADVASLKCACEPSRLAALTSFAALNATACAAAAAPPVDAGAVAAAQTLITSGVAPACDAACQRVFAEYAPIQTTFTACSNGSATPAAAATCFCSDANLRALASAADSLAKCAFLASWPGRSAAGFADAESVLSTIASHCQKANYSLPATTQAATATATANAKSGAFAAAVGSIAFLLAFASAF